MRNVNAVTILQCIEKPRRSVCRSQELFVHQSPAMAVTRKAATHSFDRRQSAPVNHRHSAASAQSLNIVTGSRITMADTFYNK